MLPLNYPEIKFYGVLIQSSKQFIIKHFETSVWYENQMIIVDPDPKNITRPLAFHV